MNYEDIYTDKDGWVEKDLPIMKVPVLRDPYDDAYEWYDDTIIIKDFEEFIPDFRRKLASKMISFIARKNSKGDYRYHLPFLNAAVAVVDNNEIKGFIDTDGFVIAIPSLSSKTYSGGIHVNLNVARLDFESPLIYGFRAVEQRGKNELVFYLDDNAVIMWS